MSEPMSKAKLKECRDWLYACCGVGSLYHECLDLVFAEIDRLRELISHECPACRKLCRCDAFVLERNCNHPLTCMVEDGQ